MNWVVILIAIVLIAFAIEYWFIAVPVIVVGLILLILLGKKGSEQAHDQNQRKLRHELARWIDLSRAELEVLVSTIAEANQFLDRAEVDFRDRAFAPFWDSIENAINCLGRLDDSVKAITSYSKEYASALDQIDGPPSLFDLGVSTLPDGVVVSERMSDMVRQAQCDFEFAMIYEQRKTNVILVEGFKNLANAIENMTNRLEDSIDDLCFSISTNLETLSGQFTETIESASDRHSEEMDSARRVQLMLDTLQMSRRSQN